MERMKDMSSTAMSAPHTLVIEDRKRLSVSGVTDVESFDEETVALATELGELISTVMTCTSTASMWKAAIFLWKERSSA